MKVEDSLNGVDYFSTVLLLQNRETADSDMAQLNEGGQDDSNSLQGKIKTALDIFENSTSREYLISLQRFQRAV